MATTVQQLLEEARQRAVRIEVPQGEIQQLLEQAQAQQESSLGSNPELREAPEETWPEYALRVIGNIPSSIGQRADDIAGFGQMVADDPTSFMRAIGHLATVPANPTAAMALGQILSAAYENERQAFTKEGFAQDPTRALSDIAAVAAPFTRAPGLMGTIAKAAGYLDPITAGIQIPGKMASVAAERGIPKANTVLAEIMGVSTGRGGPRARQMIEAGRTGEGGAMRQALRFDTPNRLGRTVRSAVKTELAKQGTAKRRFLAEQEGLIDITDLKATIENEVLPDLGIRYERPSGAAVEKPRLEVSAAYRTPDEGLFERELERILNAPDQVSVQALDDIKQGIGSVSAPKSAAKANRAIAKVRDQIRQRLGEVPGYNEVTKPLRQTYQTEEAITERLKLPENALSNERVSSPQTVGESITNAFNAENPIDRLQAVDIADKMIPSQPIATRAAAIGMQGKVPSGLIGRNQLFTVLGGLGLAAGAGGASHALGASGVASAATALGSLPLIAAAFIPRASAKVLARLGVMERGVQDVVQFNRRVYEQVKMLGLDPQILTLGQALARLDEMNQSQDTSVFRGIGRATNR